MKKVLYILAGLSDTDVEWLAEHGARRAVPAGTALTVEGHLPSSVMIVLDGRVAVSAGRLHIAEVGAGDVLGEVSFIDGSPASATATTVEPTRILELSRDALEAKIRADEGFAARFYRAVCTFLAARLRSTLAQASGTPLDIADDALDLDRLDAISRAGERFSRTMRQLG